MEALTGVILQGAVLDRSPNQKKVLEWTKREVVLWGYTGGNLRRAWILSMEWLLRTGQRGGRQQGCTLKVRGEYRGGVCGDSAEAGPVYGRSSQSGLPRCD